MDGTDIGLPPVPPVGKKSRELSFEERISIASILQTLVTNDKLRKGAHEEVAKKFGVHRTTVARIWYGAKKNEFNPLTKIDAVRSLKGNRGAKPIYDVEELQAAIKKLRPEQRLTLRGTGASVGVSASHVFRLKKAGHVKRASLSMKPQLKDMNKVSRFVFAANEVMAVPTNTGQYFFKDMYDRVHVDEKWFYLVKEGATCYLARDEEVPQLTVRNKNYITKVMFLAANARPRYDPHTGLMWDGKIGIWPFVAQVAAVRGSGCELSCRHIGV